MYSRVSTANEQATPHAHDAFEHGGGSSRRSTVDIIVVIVSGGDATEGRCEISAAVIPTGGGVTAAQGGGIRRPRRPALGVYSPWSVMRSPL